MSARGGVLIAATVALLAAAARPAGADGGGVPASAAPDCAQPADGRAPDPRCGEALDGRAPPPPPSPARTAGQVALYPTRAIAAGAFYPLVQATDVIESHHAQDWLQAWLTSDDGKVGVRPLLKYATSTVPTVGLRVFYQRLPGEGSGVATSFQTAGPAAMVGEVDAAAARWTGLSFRTVVSHRDDRYFAGIGALSQADLTARGWSAARFSSDIYSAEVRWTRALPANLRVVLHGDLQRRDYRAGGVRGGPSVAEVFRAATPDCQATTQPTNACVDPTLLPGFADGMRITHQGVGLQWDVRSHTRDGSGAALAVDATFAEGIAGDPSRHVTLSAEPVVALGHADRQIILRGRAVMVDALADAPIPFEELAVMSGWNGMRGFLDGRFRGDSGVVTTAEYRWYVSHLVDASLFTDVGTVAGHDFAGIGSARWFPSYGLGLRLYRTPGAYWEGAPQSGMQFIYAPDGGFRFILSVATF
ncbi:MAG TPA: hypothetical protein VMU50_03860 [Polyangia bacterium]|nr:hypothetical protein [Polyangia bacterium]